MLFGKPPKLSDQQLRGVDPITGFQPDVHREATKHLNSPKVMSQFPAKSDADLVRYICDNPSKVALAVGCSYERIWERLCQVMRDQDCAEDFVYYRLSSIPFRHKGNGSVIRTHSSAVRIKPQGVHYDLVWIEIDAAMELKPEAINMLYAICHRPRTIWVGA